MYFPSIPNTNVMIILVKSMTKVNSANFPEFPAFYTVDVIFPEIPCSLLYHPDVTVFEKK